MNEENKILAAIATMLAMAYVFTSNTVEESLPGVFALILIGSYNVSCIAFGGDKNVGLTVTMMCISCFLGSLLVTALAAVFPAAYIVMCQAMMLVAFVVLALSFRGWALQREVR